MSILGSIEEAAAAFAASACAQWRWFPVDAPNSQDVSQAAPNVLTPATTRTRASEMANRMFMHIDRELAHEENPLETHVSPPRNIIVTRCCPGRLSKVCALLLRFGSKT